MDQLHDVLLFPGNSILAIRLQYIGTFDFPDIVAISTLFAMEENRKAQREIYFRFQNDYDLVLSDMRKLCKHWLTQMIALITK